MGLLWLTIRFGALRLPGQALLMLSCINLIAQGLDRRKQSGSEA